MHPQILRSLALVGCTSLAAANDIVSLILPNVDNQDLVGEVIGTDGSLTTYLINCPKGTDSSDCGIPPEGITVTADDDTFIYEYTYEDYYLRESCSHRGTTWFSCAVTNTQSDFSTVMTTATSYDIPYQAVTITGTSTDADSSTTVTSISTSTNTRSPSASQPSDTSSSTDESSTTSAGAVSSSTPSPTNSEEAGAEETSSDNAAMAQVTGSATQWLVSGAGMVLALALA
ncbi:hypothetical protein BJY01DRAFT_205752 [Aspergillus pseudoustus]|uniref:GPI anchored glycoprotein n=1 Tax=Aspergillus pseudoustus TaxID=1810923 RepID=A0ABR4KSL4_9EURO